MEHTEEADSGSKVPWIASDLKQALSTGVKEQVVDEPLVLQGERSQFSRQSKDGMYIAGGQQLPFTCLKPAQARVALAPWAMPVAARVCTRWQYVRSLSTDRDAHSALRCGSL